MNTVTYKDPNKYIAPGLLDDVYECLKFIRLGEAVDILRKLGCSNLCFQTKGYNYTDLEELILTEDENGYIDAMGPVFFHGGPQQNDSEDYKFVLVQGTVLCFVVDTILYQVSMHGYDVFQKAGIPL